MATTSPSAQPRPGVAGHGALSVLVLELRRSARVLRHAPGFSALVILTVALGVGTAVTMASITRHVVLASPPQITAADQVFRVHHVFPGNDGSEEVFARTSYPFFDFVRSHQHLARAVAAYRSGEVFVDEPIDRVVRATFVSAGYWDVMATRPALGRFFNDAEADPLSGSRVAVLSFDTWITLFGKGNRALGSTIVLRGRPYTIVGVAPRGFRGIEQGDIQLWLPFFAEGDGGTEPPTWHRVKTSFFLTIAVRLGESATLTQTASELGELYRSFLQDAYGRGGSSGDLEIQARNRRSRIILGPVTGGIGEDLRVLPEARLSLWLTALSVALLAVACANLVSLQLLRATRRRNEIVVKLALGAPPSRLAYELLAETALLIGLGSAGAILAAGLGANWLQRRILPDVAMNPFGLADAALLGCVAILTGMVILAAGLAALSTVKRSALRGTSERSTTLALSKSWGLRLAVFVQGVLTTALFVGTALMFRSLYLASTEDIGMSRRTLIVEGNATGTGQSSAALVEMFENSLPRIRTIPGITQAALAVDAPLRRARVVGDLLLPGRAEKPRSSTGGPYVNFVTPGFFAATGMRLLQGRDIAEGERSTDAIVVNETLAMLYWPGESAVGKCVMLEKFGPCVPVVGVAADARRFRLGERDRYPFYFCALGPGSPDTRVLVVDKGPTLSGVESSIRHIMNELNPAIRNVRIRSLGDLLEPQMRTFRIGLLIFAAFAGLASTLGVIGLFSIVSYNVGGRTREMATRLALGATPAKLIRMVVAPELGWGLIAASAGISLALATGRFLDELLFGVAHSDRVVLIEAAVALLVLSAIASLLPIWRVSRRPLREGLQ